MTSIADLTTLEGYAALDEPEDGCVTELVRGTVLREPRPGRTHARVQFEIARRLGNWVAERGSGEILGESGFILADDPPTVRGPDVALVLRPPSGAEEPGGWIRGAPDVAIEVLSPSDTFSAVQRKTLECLEAGAARVWIVDPGARTVTVYRPDGSATLLRASHTLRDADLLPGFSLSLAELFEV